MTGTHRTIGAFIVPLLLSGAALAQSDWKDDADKLRDDELRRLEWENQNARARAEVLGFKEEAEETRALLIQLDQEARAFTERMEDLLTNDDGKRLAADPIASMGFLRWYERPIVPSAEVQARKHQVDATVSGLERILNEPSAGYAPPASQRKDTSAIYYWAQERLARIKEERSGLEASLRRLPRDIDLKNVPTMKEKIDQFMLNRIDLWVIGQLSGIEAARGDAGRIVSEGARIAELERANAEAEQLLREARLEIERMHNDLEVRVRRETAAERERLVQAEIALKDRLAELERRQLDADAERKAKGIESQLASEKKVEDAEKPMLIKRCKDPETRTILAPFLDPGMVRPSGNRGTRYYDTIEPVPVSLKDLYACGALDETPESLDKLYWATIDPQDTMRTRWRRSQQWRTTPALREKLVKAQKLLIELGPTLVELKMLQE